MARKRTDKKRESRWRKHCRVRNRRARGRHDRYGFYARHGVWLHTAEGARIAFMEQLQRHLGMLERAFHDPLFPGMLIPK